MSGDSASGGTVGRVPHGLAGADFSFIKSKLGENFSESAVDELQRNLLLGSQAHIAALESSVVNGIENSLKLEREKPTVKTRWLANSSKVSLLASTFTNYNIVAGVSRDAPFHAFAREHRRFEFMHIYDSVVGGRNPVQLGVSPWGRRYDVRWKDVGGNLRHHMDEGIRQSHCCAPTLSNADVKRSNDTLLYVCRKSGSALARGGDRGALISDYMSRTPLFSCTNLGQYCDVTAPVLSMVHASYDVTLDDLALILERSHCIRAVFTFIFHPDIIAKKTGCLGDLGCEFRKFQRGKRKYVSFNFDSDPQSAYIHEFDTYLALLTSSYIETHSGRRYTLETTFFKNSVVMIEANAVLQGSLPPQYVLRRLPFEGEHQKYVIIYSWDYNTVDAGLDHIKPIRLVCPKSLFDSALAYVCSLPSGKFTYQSAYSVLLSYNTREIVGGVSVGVAERVPPDTLVKIAVAVYIIAFIMNYENFQVIETLVDDEKQLREWYSSSWFQRLRKRLTKFVMRREHVVTAHGSSSAAHPLINKDDCGYSVQQLKEEEESNCVSTFALIKRFFLFGSVVRKYPVGFDVGPRVLALDDEIPAYTSVLPKYALPFVSIPSTRDMLESSPVVREAVGATFDDGPCAPLRPKDVVVASCKAERNELIDVPKDGDCLFHAFAKALRISDDPLVMRARCLDSVYLDSFDVNTASALKDRLLSSGIDGWGDNNCLLLLAAEYSVTACLHADGCFVRYNPGCVTVVHIHHSNSHFQCIDVTSNLDTHHSFELCFDDYEGDSDVITSHKDVAGAIVTQPFNIVNGVKEYKSQYTIPKRYSVASLKYHKFVTTKFYGYDSFYAASLYCAVKDLAASWSDIHVLDVNQNNGSSVQLFADGLGATTSVLSQTLDDVKTLRPFQRKHIRTTGDKRQAVMQALHGCEYDIVCLNPSQYSDAVGYVDITRHDSYLFNVLPAVQFVKVGGALVLAVPVFLTPTTTRVIDVLFPMFERTYAVRDNITPKHNPWLFVVFDRLKPEATLSDIMRIDLTRNYVARIVDLMMVEFLSAKIEISSAISEIKEFATSGKAATPYSIDVVNSILDFVPKRRCSIVGGGLANAVYGADLVADELPSLTSAYVIAVCKEQGTRINDDVGFSVVVTKFSQHYTKSMLRIYGATFGKNFGTLSGFIDPAPKDMFSKYSKNSLGKFLEHAYKYLRYNALLGNSYVKLRIKLGVKFPLCISHSHMAAALSRRDITLAEDKYSAMLRYVGGIDSTIAKRQVDQAVAVVAVTLNKDLSLRSDSDSDCDGDETEADETDVLVGDHDLSVPETNPIRKNFPSLGPASTAYMFDEVKAAPVAGMNAVLRECMGYFRAISNDVESEAVRCLSIIKSMGAVNSRGFRESRLAGFEDLVYRYNEVLYGNIGVARSSNFVYYSADGVNYEMKLHLDRRKLDEPGCSWLTFKEMAVLTERRLIELHDNHVITAPYPAGAGFVQAPPGCGKTTSIVKLFYELYNSGDVYVCVSSRDAKIDVINRLSEYAENNGIKIENSLLAQLVFSIDSYLLNVKRPRCEILLVDEAFMQHAGKLYLLISLSGCTYAKFFGDALQIPFVNRSPSFDMRFNETYRALPFAEVMGHTYRCPVDVCVRLSPYYTEFNSKLGYNIGLVSHNAVAPSVEVRKITTIDNVPNIDGAVYLSFKQDEKEQLVQKFGRGKTVHEFQGQQNAVIVLVRTSRAESDVIYTKMAYVIVAVSRHTKRLIYCTASSSIDPVAEMFAEQLALVDPRCQELCVARPVVAGGGTELVPEQRIAVYNPPMREYPNAAVIEKKMTVPFVSNGGLRVTVGGSFHKKFVFESFAKNHTLRLSPEVASSSTRLGSVLGFYRDYISNRHVCVDNSVLKYTSMSTMSYWINRYDPAKLAINKGNGDRFVSPAIATSVILNAFPALPNTKPIVLDRLVVSDDTSVPFTVSNFDNHVAVLNDFVRALRPRSMFVHTAHDVDIFHYSDFRVPTGYLKYNRVISPYLPYRFDRMRPVLSTGCPHELRVTPRHVVYAASKRNMIPANERSVCSVFREGNSMLSRLLAVCRGLDTSPVRPTATDMQAWADDQPERVQSMLEPPMPLHMCPMNAYKFAIKAAAKADLDCDLLNTYPCPQTILHQEKYINAVFCTIWGEIRDRILGSLDTRVIVYTGMDDATFGERLTAALRPSKAKLYNALEFDMKKYDKSQHELILEFECNLLRHFGVPSMWVDLWRNSHARCVVTDKTTKISFETTFQRKSGDASTFFGNTMALLVILLDVIPFEKIACICVAGDDSLVFTSLNPANLNMNIISQKYNLDSKLFLFKYHYFCSKFVVSFRDNWVVVPDPVKRVVKLGRTDLRNRDHVELYRVSYADNVAAYKILDVALIVSEAIKDRYKTNYDSTNAILAMADVSKSEHFHTLWYSLEGDVLCMDTSLPELEL